MKEKGRRIYVIRHGDDPVALIKAGSQAAAIHQHIRSQYSAQVADQDQLIDCLAAGLKVIDAKEMGDESQ